MATGALAPLPEKTLARRRRLIRYGGVMTFLLAAGLSAIPGPKGSSNTITYVSERGVQTQVHEFFFSRHLGLPFQTGRIDYKDDREIRSVSFKGPGFLGNLAVAFAMVVGASIFIGRRRRDD
jgi:hypothetical protein